MFSIILIMGRHPGRVWEGVMVISMGIIAGHEQPNGTTNKGYAHSALRYQKGHALSMMDARESHCAT
jgi:hypothetical protein